MPAVEGFPLDNDITESNETQTLIWNDFIKRIMKDNYLLPGTVDYLGRRRLSWVVRWPEDGFNSSSVFGELQYAGRLRNINDIPPLEVHPEKVRYQANLAKESRSCMNSNEEINNKPTASCLYPEETKFGDIPIWNGYKAWCQDSDGRLFVDAMIATIKGVKWLTSELIELSLSRQPSKVIALPLKPVPEGYRSDEANVDDIVAFLGRYLAIGERTVGSVGLGGNVGEFSMINYLEIISMEEEIFSRRGGQYCSFR